MNPVEKCFEILFPEEEEPKEFWKKEVKVVNALNDRTIEIIGEELTLRCLCCVVNHGGLPDNVRMKVVSKAEDLFPLILDVNPYHEFHMAEIEVIEHLLNEGKTVREISNMYKNKSRSE